MTVKAFKANLDHAIRNRETVSIGGGQFTPVELAWVSRFMDEAIAKLMPDPGSDRTLQLRLGEPITSREEAEAFLFRLVYADLSFHPDDPPDDILGPNGLPLFNEDEVVLIRQRMAEVHKFHEDPSAYLISLEDEE